MNDKLIEFQDKCHQAGLKVTPQRIAIYQALMESSDHPCAEEVFQKVRQQMSNISLDTVNRTLLTLSEIGAAFIVEGTGQPRRYDAGLEDHQHFRCIKCGKILDFHYGPFDKIEVPDQFKQGFQILRKTVYFEGICTACSQAVD